MSTIQFAAPSAAAPAAGAAARPRLLTALAVLTGIGVAVGLYFALGYAGQDATQGDVQRIFYIHMPAFIGAFVAFSLTVVGSVGYLITRRAKWDALALSGVEVGFTLSCINLVTGMIWSRPIWNTWWTWDPRLTLEAIMILTYAAYLMLRGGIENGELRRRFASVYGILAIITVILVLVIIRIKPDTIHPAVIGTSAEGAQGGFAMTSSMKTALYVNMLVWGALVPVTLVWVRIRLQNLADLVAGAKAAMLDK